MRSDLNKVDSCFVVISSHGTEDKECHTQIEGVDSGREDAEKILCTDILDYFTADACPQMANKPKIFIFQLCRYVAIDFCSFMLSFDFMLLFYKL